MTEQNSFKTVRGRPSLPRRLQILGAATLALLLLIGIGTYNHASSAGRSSASPGAPVSVTVAMGYVPNIQFAPFYVAQARGYYRKAGLNVHLRYGIEPDLLRLASTGAVDFVDSGGDEVLSAGAHGLHVEYVMTQYSRFPSAVFMLRGTGIRNPAGLKGKSVGVPYAFGASYVGLLALLQRAGVPQSSVNIKSIGFTQVASVQQGKVDAAVGYAMNEPVQLQQEGIPVSELDIYKWANIAGAGIAAGDTIIARRPAVVRAFVQATLHGLSDSLRNPAAAYRISAAAIKLNPNDRVQRAVLLRALSFSRAYPGSRLGTMSPAVWNLTGRLLYQFKQIPHPVKASQFYTNAFVNGG